MQSNVLQVLPECLMLYAQLAVCNNRCGFSFSIALGSPGESGEKTDLV